MQPLKHDPNAKLDYSVDWSAWLAPGETITTSTWATPTGLTATAPSLSGSVATVWIAGGTAGQVYAVTNHIITSQGREDDRSVALHCLQR